MNCYYCTSPIKKIGSTNYNPGLETFWHCDFCQTWHYCWDGELWRVITAFECRERSFNYQINVKDKTIAIYDNEDKLVVSLNHIPDWTPNNLSEKFAKLLVFS